MLYEIERHEPLQELPWSEPRARDAIERITAAALRTFVSDGSWPVHPLDSDDASARFLGLYLGAAGVMWALTHLRALDHERGAASFPDFRAVLPGMLETNRALISGYAEGPASLLIGDAGILLVDWQATRSAQSAAELARVIARNRDNPALELMWGAPGTMLAALAMHDWTGDESWGELFRTSAQALWQALEHDRERHVPLWTQTLYGSRPRLLGAVHGFAGNVFPLIRGARLLPPDQWARWRRAIVQTITGMALREPGLVNWPQGLGTPRPGRTGLLVQHCHGAPGIVTCVAGLAEPELDHLLVEAGELIWRAGPVAKGPSLCHGTAGNGYALLKLFWRTGDSVWLERARRFAMHALAQSERHLEQYGRYRYSLWTGDLGVACYLRSCIDADGGFPTMDVF